MARVLKILLISILCLIVIPLNIKAENILSGTTILGVAGTDTSKEELEYLVTGLEDIFKK